MPRSGKPRGKLRYCLEFCADIMEGMVWSRGGVEANWGVGPGGLRDLRGGDSEAREGPKEHPTLTTTAFPLYGGDLSATQTPSLF